MLHYLKKIVGIFKSKRIRYTTLCIRNLDKLNLIYWFDQSHINIGSDGTLAQAPV